MSLFGGRQTSQRSSSAGQPGASASSRERAERTSLISGGDDFDDSDAISLLSNIADRDRGSAASRRRARARARAQGRTCSTFVLDLSDLARTLSCGMLGRSSGQSPEGRQRAASIGSVMSRGARRSNRSTEGAASRHARSASDVSTDESDGGSLVGPGFESVDADAGMLDDVDIAQLSLAPAQVSAEDQRKVQEAAEVEAKAKADREAEVARLHAEAEAEAERQKEEEARLAAEEEAAVAKARRKAERKAAKAGLLKLKQDNEVSKGWRTEAEAEAAAGGFTFTDPEEAEQLQHYEGQGYAGEEDGMFYDDTQEGEGYDQYGDAEEGEAAEEHYRVEEVGPGGVVHHHHYYHAPAAPPPADETDYAYVSPSASTTADAFADAPTHTNQEAAAEKETMSEDEADIAGLSFGRKKKSRRANSGSQSGSRSGSGLHPRNLPHTGSSSGGSANGHRLAQSNLSASSSSAGVPNYRNQPRRHERTSSKSSNSSAGLFSTLHGPASTAATSVTSPHALGNVYETEGGYGSMEGGGGEVAGAQFGKADVDANEFGVITAGTNKGGAGRVKKSYREKRTKQGGKEDEGEGQEGKFEGFPGF